MLRVELNSDGRILAISRHVSHARPVVLRGDSWLFPHFSCTVRRALDPIGGLRSTIFLLLLECGPVEAHQLGALERAA